MRSRRHTSKWRRSHPQAKSETASPSSGTSRRLMWLGVALLSLATLTTALWHYRATPSIPQPDLSQAHPAVRRTLEHYSQEVRRHPRSPTAWGQFGSALYAYRQYPLALAALSEAARRDPKNPRWPYLQAIIHGISQPQLAEPLLRQTVALCGNEPPAPRLRLTRLLAEQGRWQEVDRELEPLLGLRPEPPHALLLAAQAAQHRADLTHAIDLARRAASSPWTARPALGLLSALLARAGQLDEAQAAAERSATAPGSELLIDPFDREALALRADPRSLTEQVHPLMARGLLDEASAVVDQMTRDHPDYPDSWLAAGRLALLQKNPDLAEQHLRRHLQLDPKSVQGWFQLGMAHLARRQDSAAADAFQQAVTFKPDLAPAWHNRGLALGRQGKRDEAMAAFRETLRLSPEHLDAYLLFADLQLQSGRRTEAISLLDRAAHLNPDDVRISALRRKAATIRP